MFLVGGFGLPAAQQTERSQQEQSQGGESEGGAAAAATAAAGGSGRSIGGHPDQVILGTYSSGDAVAVLYQSMPVDDKEFVKIPIPGITCKIGILWKKGVFVQENLQQFIRFVKEYRE